MLYEMYIYILTEYHDSEVVTLRAIGIIFEFLSGLNFELVLRTTLAFDTEFSVTPSYKFNILMEPAKLEVLFRILQTILLVKSW